MDNLIVYIGVPVTILVVIAALACVVSMAFSSGLKYPKLQEYSLDQPWDRAPLLFSATDIEPMALAGHAEPTDVDGGSASAKW
ncbi:MULTISPECIES: aa3-type cytochrome oxidase subunit CtaJ [unclassified Gordonia (in: high G+C Gram-positive bacteria)]